MVSRRQQGEAVVAGAAGTAAMTASLAVRARLRPGAQQPIDYDGSDHVVIAAAKVLRWDPQTPAARSVLFNIVHWGYGSAVGIAYEQLQRRLKNDAVAAAAFFAGCQTMAFALFPLLGGTPPPWRWSRRLIVSSIGQHLLYAATVAATSRALRRAHVSGHQDVYRV